MARGDQLARQWRIIQALTASQSGKTAQELAGNLGCHSRTVYRDLEALQQAGFPVYTHREETHSRWRLLDSARDPVPVPFRLTELIALYFGRDMIRPLRGTPFFDAMETLFQKVRATLPDGTAALLDRMSSRLGTVSKAHKDFSRSGKTLETVNRALMERRLLDITYYSMSRDQTARRQVAPYQLRFFDGAFYLLGYCHRREGIRTFAVDRMRSCDMLATTFAYPDGFDPDDYMAASFGIFQGAAAVVRIRFSPAVAGHIRERIWHPSQTLTTASDGCLVFEARVAVSDEIRSWVMGWGAHAEVLAPASLRASVRADVLEMAERYRDG